MSRINQALRRLSVPDSSGATGTPHDVPEPPPEASVLERFVTEGNAAGNGTTPDSPGLGSDTVSGPTEGPVEAAFERRLDGFADIATAPRAVAPRAVRRAFQIEGEWSGKVVVSPTASPTGVLQYRRLAGALAQWKRESGAATLLVTSASQGDGKTLTAVNLALTFSESFGRRVVLVDADRQRPSLHAVFGLQNLRGLSDVLRSRSGDVPAVRVSDNLSVLPAGAPDSLSTAALTSYRMESLLEQLTGSVDWVVIDAGLVGAMADSRRFARIAGGVLFVIRAGSTPDRTARRALAQLPPECLVGTVLNGVATANDVACIAR